MKKVAIVGGAPRSKHLAPYDDEEWEIWALGVHLDHPRINKIFEIHPSLHFESDDYPQRLVDTNIPLVVHDNFPFRNENIEVFDKEIAKIGQLTSSVAYMMAYAVHIGATHIRIYGVDMDVSDEEYFYQRPGVYAWIGYARGLGIDVETVETSLFHDTDYPENIAQDRLPYTESEFLKMSKIHQKKIDEYNDQIVQIQRLVDTHGGCKQAYDRLAKIARATDVGIEVLQIDHSTVIRR